MTGPLALHCGFQLLIAPSGPLSARAPPRQCAATVALLVLTAAAVNVGDASYFRSTCWRSRVRPMACIHRVGARAVAAAGSLVGMSKTSKLTATRCGGATSSGLRRVRLNADFARRLLRPMTVVLRSAVDCS